jgi:hypothetical protein
MSLVIPQAKRWREYKAKSFRIVKLFVLSRRWRWMSFDEAGREGG